MSKLHIDIETFSSVNIKKAGLYRYIESPDFEILLIAYALDYEPVTIIDLKNCTEHEILKFINLLLDPKITKHAHNAAFERIAFRRIGYDIPVDQWRCSMIKAAYCGLPLALDKISQVLSLGAKGKLSTGTILINYFAQPCKPTKANGGRTRNLPEHNPEKWENFKTYCKNDVEAEREIDRILQPYELPAIEQIYYELDQKINDRGILIDIDFAQKALDTREVEKGVLFKELKGITGAENPNSDAQIKQWLYDTTGVKINSLAKESILALLGQFESGAVLNFIERDKVHRVLKLRQETGKTSTNKYLTMVNSACTDDRGRGYLQFYGANRTGRWAGRFVQVQNLPRNYLKDLDVCREIVKTGDQALIDISFDNTSDILSQLIRTAFIAKEGHTFLVADFSQIEARVLSWLAGAEWKLDIFRENGDIYKAAASTMFNIKIEDVTKEDRQLGKISELALGYGGSAGALEKMENAIFGGNHEPLTQDRKNELTARWREKNPEIVNYWSRLDKAAKRTLETRRTVRVGHVVFLYDGTYLTIELPSGRKLFYYKPGFTTNRFGGVSIKYGGSDQETKNWGTIETYGAKIAENIVQAVSRDLLANSMLNLDKAGFNLVMHVHDEAIVEEPDQNTDTRLNEMCGIMGMLPTWAEGLPLKAEGFISKYYKK
jgi:DNA polymerase